MGIEILSFTIKDIDDKVQYLDSLGKTQTAKVKRDADIGVAEANRDAGIRVYNYKILIIVMHWLIYTVYSPPPPHHTPVQMLWTAVHFD